MNKGLLIVGAGETAALAYEYFTHDSPYRVCAFAVERAYLSETSFCGLPVIALDDAEKSRPPEECDAFVAMAGAMLNRQRTLYYQKTKAKGYSLASYVSSRAFVWHNVKIGENCFILENNTLQPFTEVGNNVVMWSGNHLGHRSVIRDNCFITSHVVICGCSVIGENSYIGVNASIGDGITVGADNFIAMGAVVGKNTRENKVYRGNPAVCAPISAKTFCQVKEN